jgi:hypothetical protein
MNLNRPTEGLREYRERRLLKDVQSQMPQAICEMTSDGGINGHLLINRDKPRSAHADAP